MTTILLGMGVCVAIFLTLLTVVRIMTIPNFKYIIRGVIDILFLTFVFYVIGKLTEVIL